jgi:predicted DCC family thiol-disulfide oxidoreductase YuxK
MSSSQTSTNVSTTLPDPDTKAGRDVVLYDGNCNACALAARRLHQMDLGSGRLAFMSLHDARVGQRYPDLSFDDLMAQMYVIDRAGNRHGGADAVRYLTRRLPLMWPLMPLLHIPGTAKLWRRLYRVVARNRYWISSRFFGTKNDCESGACEIHHR